MHRAYVIPQNYPWIDGVQVCKVLSSSTILSATYGAAGTSVAVDITLPLSLVKDMDIKKIWGDPAYGQPKKLSVTIARSDGTTDNIILDEWCGQWRHPLYYHPTATLDVTVNGGLSNQIYEIAVACLVAKRTHRRFAFPPRVLARKHCLEKVCTFDRPANEVDAPFSHLFDVDHFVAHCGVKLCRLEAGDTAVTQMVTVKDKEGKTVEERPAPDLRFIPDGPYTTTAVIASTEVATHYCLPYAHISLLCPLLSVWPATRGDYDAMLDVVTALKPASRLQTIADDIFTRFLGDSELLAVHCRIEEDWKAALALHVASAQLIIDSIRRVHKPSSVYIIGNTNNETVWAELKSKAPEYKWLRKEDFGIRDLGFEEGAIIDRDLACRVPYFLGFSFSTLSLLVGLARHRTGKPYFFYDMRGPGNNPTMDTTFWYKNGKPLQDQFG